MWPLVEGLKQKYGGKVDIRRVDAEGDASEVALARKLNVTGVPTFVFVNSDGVIARTVVGEMTQDALTAAVAGLR